MGGVDSTSCQVVSWWQKRWKYHRACAGRRKVLSRGFVYREQSTGKGAGMVWSGSSRVRSWWGASFHPHTALVTLLKAKAQLL